MSAHTSRCRGALLTVALAALGGCAAEQPTIGEPKAPDLRPNFSLGDAIVVTNASGGSDVGSLRWAVGQATGGEQIQFDSRLAGATITLDTTLVIPSFVTIVGPDTRGITISGGGKVRVLHAMAGATLENLTITGGNADVGGGILSAGGLTIRNSTIAGNTAGTDAAIRADTVALVNSTVTNNTSTSDGVGGIGYAPFGLLLLHSTTLSHNGGTGIGAYTVGSTTPRVVLLNSILAGNSGGNCAATLGFDLQGRNIVDDASCGTAPEILVADPLLGPLADNGGPTMTRALAPGSLAIDGADCSTFGNTIDQRYVPRDEVRCDIGAYEMVSPNAVTVTLDAIDQVDRQTGAVTVTGTLTCSRSESGIGIAIELTEQQRSKSGSITVHGTGVISDACKAGGVEQWAATITPSSGAKFSAGAASVVATVSSSTSAGSVVSADVSLVFGHK